VAIVDGDKMWTGYIENDEVLGPRVRRRTGGARMAKLITISEVLKRLLVETFSIPSLCIVINMIHSHQVTKRRDHSPQRDVKEGIDVMQRNTLGISAILRWCSPCT
jgi:hypothetical protein